MNSLFKSIPPIGLLLFGLWSCSLEDATPPLPLSAVDPLPLAKEFYAQEKPKQVTSSFRIQTEQEFFPFWAGAKSHANGRILIVPAHRKLQVRYEAGYLRRFVFELDASGQVQRGGMLELSGKDSKFLLQNEELLIEGFLAGVKSKDLTYLWSDFVARPLDGTQADGRVVALQREGGAKSRLDAEALRTEFCIDWYWVYSFNGVVVYEVYSHTTCGSASCDTNAHDACLDDGVGGGGDQIINKLTDPCASEIFDQIKNGGLISAVSVTGTEFSKSILDLLNRSQKYDFVIFNSSNISKNGKTTTKVFNQNTGKYDVKIELSNNYLNQATQLSVVRTIIHESIHAYLLHEQYTNTTGDLYQDLTKYAFSNGYAQGNQLHHEFMPQFIDAIAYSLWSWDMAYGSKGQIPLSYMKDLAWGGMTSFRNPDGTIEYYDSFKANFPDQLDKNRIEKNIKNESDGNNSAKSKKCS
jgi:hypothetical protein